MNDNRELFLFAAGHQLFAVSAGEVAGTAELASPARLPLAPAAILGVVCLRSRMLTVIDPTALTNGRQSESRDVVPLVVVLRGDEQLALAADRVMSSLQVAPDEIRPATTSEGTLTTPGAPPVESALIGSLERQGQHIFVLDPRKLFAAAMGTSERRRRRA